MAILPPNSDYTTKDFEALKKRLESLLRSVFPAWTDFQVINFGNFLVEAFCFIGDVLSFGQDANAREGRIVTATQRRTLLQLVKLIDYTPARAEAATTDQQFVFEDLVDDVNVPAGTIVKSEGENPVEFQTLSPVTATVADPVVTVTVEHSKTEDKVQEGDGSADQAIELPETPFLKIVTVEGASSGEWSEVEHFLSSGPTDKHFIVRIDNEERATIVFGNGAAGQIPSDVITVTYKTGGGAEGNVAAGSLTKIDGGLLDVLGNPTTFETSNPSAAAGGVDRETLESIKANAPASIRNPRTTVSREDFEDHATSPDLVTGIARALMLTHDEDVTIAENAGRLFVVPEGGPGEGEPGFASAAKLQEVRAVMVGNTQSRAPRPVMATFSLTTESATYIDVAVRAVAYLTKEAASTAANKSAVKAAADAALAEFFRPKSADGTKNSRIDFGYYLRVNKVVETDGEIPLSDLMNAVRDVEGVRKVGRNDSDFTITTETVTPALVTSSVQTAVHEDVRVDDTWFPRYNGLTLIDGDTGLEIT